jgi:hypothetical protein
MFSTTRSLAPAAILAILSAALGCGGSVTADPFPSVDPAPDAAVVATATTAGPPVASDPIPPEAAAPAPLDSGSDSVSSLPPLPCEQRAVPAKCSSGDAPYYTAADLEAAWTGCGGTSGVDDRCGVLSVSFDASGCASITFTGMPPLSGAVACLTAQLGAYRFECSAGSGIDLNHLCN